MNKHTPKPWKSSHPMLMDATAHRVESIKVNAENKGIAVMSDYRMEQSEAWANARLIAAAPELLDAVLGLLDAFADHRWDSVPVVDQARNAVFLAIGEEYAKRN